MTKNTVTINMPLKCKDCNEFEPEIKAISYHVGNQSMCEATAQCKHKNVCDSIERRYSASLMDKKLNMPDADDASQGVLAPAT